MTQKINKVSKTNTAKARVTSIAVSRLFNTGNFTNARYDISAEVPPGVSASETITHISKILEAMRPISSPSCMGSYLQAIKRKESELSNYEIENMPAWKEQMAEFYAKKAARNKTVIEISVITTT